MGIEIERKFLVINDNWRNSVTKSSHYTQGYFATNDECSIRIRISDDKAELNIKSATLGISRSEYNYSIPMVDAEEILNKLCIRPLIEKTRFHVEHENHLWEIDEFTGENEGLVVAEIELDSADTTFSKPEWAGDEVSDDVRYYNVCLVKNPFTTWS